MQQQFTHIATLLYKHTYFEEGTFSKLITQLASASREVLRDLGILLKPFEGGIHILTSEIDLLNTTGMETPLRITLVCNDPYFINYTNLPIFQPVNDCLCFHNLGTTNTQDTGVLRLQKEPFVGVDEVMKVSNGKVSLRSFDPEANYTFSNASGAQLAAPFVQHPNPSVNYFLINDIPEGIIYVFENNVLKETESLYFQPSSLWKQTLGVVELYPRTLYHHYTENENTVYYSIDFDARKTIRKYFIVQNSANPFEQLTIIDRDRKEIFERGEDDNGAAVFISKASHPLSNTPNLPLQLVNNFVTGAHQEKIVVAHLPQPSPNKLFPSKNPEDTILSSHIYVYL